MKIILSVVMLLICLTGCNTAPSQPEVPSIPEITKTVNFDQSLLKDCPTLPRTKSSSDEDLKSHISEVTKLYVECAKFKKAQNQEVKKAFNIK